MYLVTAQIDIALGVHKRSTHTKLNYSHIDAKPKFGHKMFEMFFKSNFLRGKTEVDLINNSKHVTLN